MFLCTFLVNTAARMESTGIKDRIQLSQGTAELLEAAGKGRWLEARKDLVKAKGKGEMKTYWLNPRKQRVSSSEIKINNSNLRTDGASGSDGALPTVHDDDYFDEDITDAETNHADDDDDGEIDDGMDAEQKFRARIERGKAMPETATVNTDA